MDNLEKISNYCESKYIESPKGTLYENCYTTKEACILSSKLDLNGIKAEYIEGNELKEIYVKGRLAISFV